MKKEEVTVIGATMADLPEVMELFREMHAENAIFQLDEQAAIDVLARALRRPNPEGVLGVIRENGRIAGMILLIVTKFWYTKQFHLEELYNYIHPNYRRSNYADALIRFAKHSAEQLGIPLIIGVLTNNKMEPKVRLYRRRLGMPAGAFFIHNADWYNERALNTDLWKHTRKRVPSLLNAAVATTMVTPAIMSS